MAAHDRIEALAFRLGWRPSSRSIPHAIKRRIVRQHARAYGLRVLVETGTYVGDMMASMSRHFDTLHSIELSDVLYERAQLRLASRRNVRLYQGHSAMQLRRLLEALEQPALFWLDAHFSGGITAGAGTVSPVAEELRLVLAHPVRGHVVLVDDARLFTNADGYPSMAALRELVRRIRPDLRVAVEHDIIRITPSACACESRRLRRWHDG